MPYTTLAVAAEEAGGQEGITRSLAYFDDCRASRLRTHCG